LDERDLEAVAESVSWAVEQVTGSGAALVRTEAGAAGDRVSDTSD
jgi:hypothetical protein